MSGSVTGIYGGISSMEQEIAYLTKLNPKINIVIYTLDFCVAASIPPCLKIWHQRYRSYPGIRIQIEQQKFL